MYRQKNKYIIENILDKEMKKCQQGNSYRWQKKYEYAGKCLGFIIKVLDTTIDIVQFVLSYEQLQGHSGGQT